jgi:ferritin-like metal-binding protein YciE
MENLCELLEEQVKDLYSAENQLVKALPKMAKAASTSQLKQAIESHLKETQGHVERLEQVAEQLGTKPTGKTCAGMKGLIEEGKEALEEGEEGPILDAAIIAAAQRVEHYEISGYGTARALAEHLGNSKVAQLFQETLDEEVAADEKLTDVAEGPVYGAADTGDSAASDEDEEPATRSSRRSR